VLVIIVAPEPLVDKAPVAKAAVVGVAKPVATVLPPVVDNDPVATVVEFEFLTGTATVLNAY
jgi:hypothetical protein